MEGKEIAPAHRDESFRLRRYITLAVVGVLIVVLPLWAISLRPDYLGQQAPRGEGESNLTVSSSPPPSEEPRVERPLTGDPSGPYEPTFPPNMRMVQSSASHLPRFSGRLDVIPERPLSEDLRTLIASKCESVRRLVVKKWILQSRAAEDGARRVHVAFLGDGNGRRMWEALREDIKMCIPGAFREWDVSIANEVAFASRSHKSVYVVERTGTGDGDADKNEEALVELVLSFHQVAHSKNVLQTLANAYAPLFKDNTSEVYAPLKIPSIRYDLTPVVRDEASADHGKPVPGTWLSPSFNLSAPDVLYLSSGMWDIANAEPVWSGVEYYSHDVYMRNDFSEYLAHTRQTLKRTLHTNYTEPMKALFEAWRVAWEQEPFRRGTASRAELAYAPPAWVMLMTPPRVNCRGTSFTPRRAQATPRPFDYRLFVRGVERCSAILLPVQETVLDELRAVGSVAENLAKRAASGELPSFHFLDLGTEELPCHRADGTRIDLTQGRCRRFIMDKVYQSS